MRNQGSPPRRRASGREKPPPAREGAPAAKPAKGTPPPAEIDASDDAITRSFRGYPERDVWTQIPVDTTVPRDAADVTVPMDTTAPTDATVPIPARARPGSRGPDPDEPRRRPAKTDPAARDAWMREMTLDGGLSEEEAARLWDSDPPLSGNEMFARGFHSRDAEVADRERKIEIGKDDLRQLGRQVEGLLTELEERYADLHRLETALAGARRALRAASVIAAAGAHADLAGEPDKLRAVAAQVLSELREPDPAVAAPKGDSGGAETSFLNEPGDDEADGSRS